MANTKIEQYSGQAKIVTNIVSLELTNRVKILVRHQRALIVGESLILQRDLQPEHPDYGDYLIISNEFVACIQIASTQDEVDKMFEPVEQPSTQASK